MSSIKSYGVSTHPTGCLNVSFDYANYTENIKATSATAHVQTTFDQYVRSS